ncbi:MAG: rod shape-determining protein MreC [Caulobacteraceae bacterium]|nr:rod shape-determining protein MreC [Caulobacteraceae bacterium]
MSFRDRPILEMKVPLTWTAGVAVLIALVIGVALLFGDRRETFKSQAYGVTKSMVDTAAAPVNGVLAAPGRFAGSVIDDVRDYFFAGMQNSQLRAEVADLEHWRDDAIALRNENTRLRVVLGLKTDPPVPMAAAHVIADAHGPFADTRLADAGLEQGVVVGNPVMSERGLVGRIVGVGHGVSRILLLTDIVSRTPVMIDRTGARAILTGDGGPNPKLSYLRGQDPVKPGDRILTSGDGGVFPRGLPVGVAVRGVDGSWRAQLESDNAPIDFVRILKFTDFSQLADDKALSAGAMPPLARKDAAEVAAEEAQPPVSPAGPAAAGAAKPALSGKVAATKAAAPKRAVPKSAGARSGEAKLEASKTDVPKPKPAKTGEAKSEAGKAAPAKAAASRKPAAESANPAEPAPSRDEEAPVL